MLMPLSLSWTLRLRLSSEYMDEPAPQPPVLVVRPKGTFGALIAAAIFGALIAITLLYMWGARIAQERGSEVLRPSTDSVLP